MLTELRRSHQRNQITMLEVFLWSIPLQTKVVDVGAIRTGGIAIRKRVRLSEVKKQGDT